MPSPVRTITVDCSDPYTLARFWSRTVGSPIAADCGPGDTEVCVDTPEGRPGLLFLRVPEGKAVKNRIHLDLGPNSATRDDEVERLLGLGATFLSDFRSEDGRGFVVLADPEGNEFCVERGDGELAAADGGGG